MSVMKRYCFETVAVVNRDPEDWEVRQSNERPSD